MMFFSFERNSSSVPLSCGFTLGFIPSPQNKIARFQRSSRQNLAISQRKNQLKSYAKMLLCSIFNRGLVARPGRFELPTLCFEAMHYKTLSAATGVAYEEARHLSRP